MVVSVFLELSNVSFQDKYIFMMPRGETDLWDNQIIGRLLEYIASL